jgi:hypothetical protein
MAPSCSSEAEIVRPVIRFHTKEVFQMLVARQVFHAKYGRSDELVTLFRELNARMREEGELFPQFRILTDVSGPFFTVVTEVTVENLAAWEGSFRESMARPWVDEWFSRMTPLVDSGAREFLHVVE